MGIGLFVLDAIVVFVDGVMVVDGEVEYGSFSL